MAKKKPSKKKSTPKKTVKKSAPKKSVGAKKKVVKKVAKKTAKKAVTKPAKKAGKKSAPAKAKAPAKKSSSAKVTSSLNKALQKAPAPKIDLSDFVTPLDDRIMVVLAKERRTEGGLYIPDTVSMDRTNLNGFVVSVGRGHMNKKGRVQPLDVKIGDEVVFPQHAAIKAKIQNEDVLIVRESEIMVIISK